MRLGVAAAVVDGELVRGDVEVADGIVRAVGLAGTGRGLAVPGLVDLQVNGYDGVDVARAEPGDLVALARALARDGVLWYQPTLVTAPLDELRAALGTIGLAGSLPAPARILGAHLEGPFLSAARIGAHPAEHLLEPGEDRLAALLASGCPVSMMTLAPELDGAAELIQALVRAGVVASLGHSDASAAAAHAGFDLGARSVTHIWNAMAPLAHRAPCLAGAALAREDVTVMAIADGVHLAPEALLIAWRAARGRLALVSDAIPAAGMPDGTYRFAGGAVHVEGGRATRSNGTLAGATRPLAWGLRLLIELGVPIVEAVDAVTRAPAALLGRADVGRLAAGSPADLVVLDDAFAVEQVYVAGTPLASH